MSEKRPIRHNLPSFPTPFVGRADEIADLCQLLDNPDCRLLTLVGPGGIGKTRLAVEVARRKLDTFPNGVYFVPLQPLQAADQVVPAVIDALPLQVTSNPQQQLIDYLHDKHLLLLLDNFEHLLAGASLVSRILAEAPPVTLLVSSREALNVQGEWVRQVSSLTYPDEDNTQASDGYSAIELFAESAQRLRGDFSLLDEYVHIVRICQMVEGMPLGIELAAGWTTALTCAEIAVEIQRGLDFLTTETRDLPERHRSMQAVFDHSWHLLTEDERAVMRRFAVFRGGCTREAAEQITGATLKTLSGLVTKSMLRHDPAVGRYDVQELMRQYAYEQLVFAGDNETTHDGHCRYYAEFMMQCAPDIKGRRQLAGLEEIEADWNNVRMAWMWALAHRDWDAIGQMMETLHLFCDMRARFADGEALFQAAVEALEPDAGEKPHRLWGELLVRAAAIFDLPESVSPADMARVGDILERARHEAHMGDDPLYLCVRANLFRPVSAEHNGFALLKASLAGFRIDDDRYSMSRTLRWLAFTCAYLGEDYAEQFASYNQQYLDLTREIGDEAGMTHALFYAGVTAFDKHRMDEAEHHFHEAGTIWRKVGDWKSVAVIYYYLGAVAFRRGEFEQAKPLLKEAVQLAFDMNFAHIPHVARDILGTIACFEGDYMTGQQILSGLSPRDRDLPRLGLIAVACGLGDFRLARAYLLKTSSWYATRTQFEYEALGEPRFEYEALAVLPMAAILLAHDGELEWAVELLARQASERKILMGWFERWALLGQTCDDLEKRLGKTVFDAAWKRGETLDVETIMRQLLAYLGGELASNQVQANGKLDEPLTERELEVLALLAQGRTNRQIAEALVVTVGTIKRYVYDICQKLEADNRTHAVARAREYHLL